MYAQFLHAHTRTQNYKAVCCHSNPRSWGTNMQSDVFLLIWATMDICFVPDTYWKFSQF